MLLRMVLIFVGGGCGSVLRDLLSGWVKYYFANPATPDAAIPTATTPFPVGTLTVNILGCLAIGFLVPVLTGPLKIREEYHFALVIGMLGGFTTFSSFAWESLSLANDRQYLQVGLYILLSTAVGLAAAWAGSRVAIACAWSPTA